MKKIVVNTRFGGFRLSNTGLLDYMLRKGKRVYFYEHQTREDGMQEYVKIDPSSVDDVDSRILFTVTKDFGEKILDPSLVADDDYVSNCEIERDDPDLVATVEELKDSANGAFARLRIVEIPDDVDWEISDYDGMEHVEEKHRKWYANRK